MTALRKQKNYRTFKKIILRVFILLAALLVLAKGIELWIESNFQSKINTDPNRAYNITFSKIDIDPFFYNIILDSVSIKPLNLDENQTIIEVNLAYATIQGFLWKDLLFRKRLNIDKIEFAQPKFDITLSRDSIQKTNGKEMQAMFSDILTRANIKSFKIDNGSVVLKDPNTKAIKWQVQQINLLASEIDTDSIKFAHLIPFEMSDMHVSMKNISYNVNDYTQVNLDQFEYNLRDKEILLNKLSLDYSFDWLKVSKKLGYQTDIVQYSIDKIGVQQFETSNNFYSKLDIVAEKISVEGLDIKLRRNKNIPRPPDVEKPTFQGGINAIPISYAIDTVQLEGTTLTYVELGLNQKASGSVMFNKINANITGTTNMPGKQKELEKINMKINAKLLGRTGINLALEVPYNSNSFSLAMDVGKMQMKHFNTASMPLMGIEMASGEMKRINFYMNSGEFRSQNKLIFDYDNFHIKLMDEKHKGKTKGLLSAIADGAIRKKNLPEQKKYVVADYASERNIHRSSINYIIKSFFQGMPRIVPKKLTQKLIIKGKPKKKKGKK